jgi:hypothetical protein
MYYTRMSLVQVVKKEIQLLPEGRSAFVLYLFLYIMPAGLCLDFCTPCKISIGKTHLHAGLFLIALSFTLILAYAVYAIAYYIICKIMHIEV